MTLTRRSTMAAIATMALARTASAQDYPSRSITIIVPYSAGGGMDVIARAVGKRLSEELGQPVVVENRTGANGLIGVTAAVRAKPDGYTLLMANTTPNSIMPLISKEVGYDPLKDLTPLAIVSYSPMLLVVNAESPIRALADLIALGKTSGKAINFGTLGVGATSHLVGARLKAATATNIVYIPYRGEANTVLAILAKEIDVAVVTGTSAVSHVESGKIRVIANLNGKRSPLYPDVPTVAESGIPDLTVDLWFGFMGPAGMSPAVAALLERKLRQIAMEPEMQARFGQLQMTAADTGSEAFGAQLESELDRFGRIVNELQISGEIK